MARSAHRQSRPPGWTCILLASLLCLATPTLGAWGFGSSDAGKVLLTDVQTLTLRSGQKTTGRRSSPVPQLSCVGGSARGQFTPQVVQCYNRGSDGQDVQWECKSDMDNLFRFGSVEVICEGYDYPDDPYILKGSCGLEYTLDHTKEGHDRQKNHDYYGGGGGGGGNSYSGGGWHSNSHSSKSSNYKQSSGGGWGDLVLLFVVGVVIYAMYKTCFRDNEMGDRQYSSTDGDYPRGNPGGGGWFTGGGGTQGQNYYGGGGYDDAACGGGRRYNRGTGAGGGGFWTGMATGGLMGYMFGNRGGGNRGYNRGYGGGWGTQNAWGGGGGTGWGGFGGGGGGSGFGGSSSSSSSSGTRTASGFGGTRRR